MTPELIAAHDAAAIAAADAIENEHPTRAELGPLALVGTAAPTREPIGANCRREFTARRHSGRRPLEEIRWIVLHSTEGATARGAATWFANPSSQGSAHLCLDDFECYRTLANELVPWGARGANYRGFHIEQAGYARWSRLVWSRSHRRLLERAAYKTALHCRRFGIPPYFVTATELRAGLYGVTTHNECTRAFGGTHWDPGRGWPRRLFMRRVRHHYALL